MRPEKQNTINTNDNELSRTETDEFHNNNGNFLYIFIGKYALTWGTCHVHKSVEAEESNSNIHNITSPAKM